MVHLQSLPTFSASHLIGLLAVKLLALSVAISISEARGREVIPLIGVVYAVSLPMVLWLAAS